MYDSSQGRFLSEDPIGLEGGDPNLYRYVHNSPTNATDPSGLVGEVGLGVNLAGFFQSPAFFKSVAASRISINGLMTVQQQKQNPLTAAIMRNIRISAAYAELAGTQPSVFLWMGAASAASNQVGGVMRGSYSQYRTSRGNNQTTLANIAEKLVETLGTGNKAVYDDLYWQHLAFRTGGIDLMRGLASSGEITARHLAGWEKIASGIANNNPKDIFEGNAQLFRYEQQEILQPAVFGNDLVTLALKATPTAVSYPIKLQLNRMTVSPLPPYTSFNAWAKANKIALPNVTNSAQRIRWGLDTVVGAYAKLTATDMMGITRRFNELIEAEKKMLRTKQIPY